MVIIYWTTNPRGRSLDGSGGENLRSDILPYHSDTFKKYIILISEKEDTKFLYLSRKLLEEGGKP